ncbi:MAG: hypothetical protein ABSE64_07950 [Vulcanimicrobiaceae bacterium]
MTRERAATLIKPQLVGVHPSLRGTTGTFLESAFTNEDRALVFLGLERSTIVNNQYIGREYSITLTSNGRGAAAADHWNQTPMGGIVAWDVPLGAYQLDAVTGIQQSDKSHAFVTFTYETIPNDTVKRILAMGHSELVHAQSPLAALASAPGSQAQQTQADVTALIQAIGGNTTPTFEDVFKKTNNATLPFTLYDDGWRVGQ